MGMANRNGVTDERLLRIRRESFGDHVEHFADFDECAARRQGCLSNRYLGVEVRAVPSGPPAVETPA
jgi:hypothetical protein